MRAAINLPIAAAIIAPIILGGCGDKRTVVRDRIERVSVPVAVGCVSGERPAAVTSLKDQISADQWKALTLKQKAENVSAQALRHQSYGQAVSAATGACK